MNIILSIGNLFSGLPHTQIIEQQEEYLLNKNKDTDMFSVKRFIEQDTIWRDTVKLYKNVIIGPESTLEIYPGTYIESQGFHTIEVQGRILAQGSAENPIIFTINDTTGFSEIENISGSWKGFKFTGPTIMDTSILRYCILEYCFSLYYPVHPVHPV